MLSDHFYHPEQQQPPQSPCNQLSPCKQQQSPCKQQSLCKQQQSPCKARRSPTFCISGFQPWVSFCIYLLVGTSVCFGWNSLVNCITSIRSIFYPMLPKFSQPITATYHTSVVVGAIILMTFDARSVTILLIGLMGSGLASFLFVYLCFCLINNPMAPWFLCIPASLLGLFVAFALTSAFAFASSSPSRSAAVSSGMALAGLATFGTWLVVSRCIFNLGAGDSIQAIGKLKLSLVAMSVVQGFVALLSVVAILMLFANDKSTQTISNIAAAGKNELGDDCGCTDAGGNDQSCRSTKQPAAADNDDVDEANSTKQSVSCNNKLQVCIHSSDDEQQQHCSPTSWSGICISNYKLLLCLFVTLATSLYLFPNIWPLAWMQKPLISDVLMGVFQAGDFIGRFLPMLMPKISSRVIIIMTAIRFVVVAVLYTITSSLIASKFHWVATCLLNVGVETFFMLIMATSNGFIATLCFMDFSRALQSSLAKSKASTLGLAAMLAGVAVGNTLSVFNPLS